MVSSPRRHVAFVIVTRSAGAGAPGVTVIVVVRVKANHDAVIVTLVVVVTGDVATAKVPLDAPPLTTMSAGTLATAGLLEESCTPAPSVTAVKRTVPVDPLPPVTLVGDTDTDDREAPAGVAALTDRVCVRPKPSRAAVMATLVAGAEALVVIGKVPLVAPPGRTRLAGTDATDGSLLKSSTVVGSPSAKLSATVPVEDAPPRTVSGLSPRLEMPPPARAGAGRTRTSRAVDTAVSSGMRRKARVLIDSP
jgi:hypothetical protein